MYLICAICCDSYEPFKNFTKFKFCKRCFNEEKTKWNFELRCRRKGITTQFFHDELKKQTSCCACCERPFQEIKEALIEHCHITGKFRGLCCHSCNNMLAAYKEDINLMKNRIKSLEKLIQYLEKHPK